MKIRCYGLLVLLASVLPAWAVDVPNSFNYQGVLRNGTGGGLPAAPTLIHFKLYNVPANGSALWSRDATVLLDTNGLFNVTLSDDLGGTVTNGSLTNVIAGNTTLFLGLTVEGNNEISPRQQLLSVPFALRAGNVDQASGNFTVNGSLIVNNGATITGKMQADSLQVGTHTLTTNSAGNGNLTLGGNLDLSDQLHVMKNLSVDGNTTLSSNLTVAGLTTLNGPVSALTVAGPTVLSSSLTVAGPATASTLTVNGSSELLSRNVADPAAFVALINADKVILTSAQATSDGFIVINLNYDLNTSDGSDKNQVVFSIKFEGGLHARAIDHGIYFNDVDATHIAKSDIITLPVLKNEKVTLHPTIWTLKSGSSVNLRAVFVPFGTTL